MSQVLWRSMEGTFFVSSDRSLLSVDVWSLATSLDPQLLLHALNASAVVLGVYREPDTAADDSDDCTGSREPGQPKPVMVGFARLISDSVRFAFLADLYILPSYRRLGLGKALLSCIRDHPANGVYRQIIRLPSGSPEDEDEDRNALRRLLESSGYKLVTPMDSRGIYTMHRVRSLSVDINEENRGPREWRNDKSPDYFASTDKKLLQVEVIHRYLSEESYWAKGISMDAVKLRVDGSFCIGLYERKLDGSLVQIANGRWVTDMTTFAYLADVFVLPSYQGNGLGKWFVTNVLMRAFDTENFDDERVEAGGGPRRHLKDIMMRLILNTSTAVALYERYADFEVIPDDEYLALQIGS